MQCEHIPRRWPLLVVHGSKGLLACGYVNSPTGTNKTGDAAACMTMCLTHADFLEATVSTTRACDPEVSPSDRSAALWSQVRPGSVSESGVKLGLKDGMPGIEALNLIR